MKGTIVAMISDLLEGKGALILTLAALNIVALIIWIRGER